jgi:hypothetical protein
MCIPIIRLGKSFVDAIIEVLVMRENDMSANIIELPYSISNRILKGDQETHKSLGCDIGRSKPSRGFIRVNEEPGSLVLEECCLLA